MLDAGLLEPYYNTMTNNTFLAAFALAAVACGDPDYTPSMNDEQAEIVADAEAIWEASFTLPPNVDYAFTDDPCPDGHTARLQYTDPRIVIIWYKCSYYRDLDPARVRTAVLHELGHVALADEGWHDSFAQHELPGIMSAATSRHQPNSGFLDCASERGFVDHGLTLIGETLCL